MSHAEMIYLAEKKLAIEFPTHATYEIYCEVQPGDNPVQRCRYFVHCGVEMCDESNCDFKIYLSTMPAPDGFSFRVLTNKVGKHYRGHHTVPEPLSVRHLKVRHTWTM